MLKCIFENGNEASLRHVTVDVLVLLGEKILLIRRNKKILEGGKWGLLGGYVERDETLKEAAEREILEESGYKVQNLRLLTIRDNPDRPHEDRQNIACVFFCEATDKVGTSDWEVDEEQWFSLDALPDKDHIAFDHFQNIQLYKRYLVEGLELPYLRE